MKTISATDAKSKFGDLITGPQGQAQPDEAYLNKVLSEYSNGDVSRRQIEEVTGLWFGEILSEMAKRKLSLPRVNSAIKFNANQSALFERIFPV